MHEFISIWLKNLPWHTVTKGARTPKSFGEMAGRRERVRAHQKQEVEAEPQAEFPVKLIIGYDYQSKVTD